MRRYRIGLGLTFNAKHTEIAGEEDAANNAKERERDLNLIRVH